MPGDSSAHSCETVPGGDGARALYHATQFTDPHGFTSGIEGPACDHRGNLYAVNFAYQGTIGRITPDGHESLFVELPDGSIGNGIRFGPDGCMFIADYTRHNILRINMESGAIDVYAHEHTMYQPNDIAVTGDGTLFASDPNWSDSTGQVWRIDRDGSVHRMESGMGTTNGIEISPGDDRLYVNESVQRRVWVYDLPRSGRPCNKRLLIEFPDFGLDGMRCDIRGNLYVTRHGQGRIIKLSPEGEVLEEIHLSGQAPTNIAFGGPDGCTCYTTVADNGNIESFRVDTPGRAWSMLNLNASNHL